MAQFCSDGCKDVGSICDFCRNFKGNYDENNIFEGDGLCLISNTVVEADDGYKCDNFICFLV